MKYRTLVVESKREEVKNGWTCSYHTMITHPLDPLSLSIFIDIYYLYLHLHFHSHSHTAVLTLTGSQETQDRRQKTGDRGPTVFGVYSINVRTYHSRYDGNLHPKRKGKGK